MESLSGRGQTGSSADALYGCFCLRCGTTPRRIVFPAQLRSRPSSADGTRARGDCQRKPRARRSLLSHNRRTLAGVSGASANHRNEPRSLVSLGVAPEFCTTYYLMDLVKSRTTTGAAGGTPGLLHAYLPASVFNGPGPFWLGNSPDCAIRRSPQSPNDAPVYSSFGPRLGGTTHARNEPYPRLARANPGACF